VVVKCAFFLARLGVFAFSANTVTGKRTWSHPPLPVWAGGEGEMVIGKWLLVFGHCNRVLAGITFFPIGNKKYL
jgi:hypothetical protein